MMLYDFSLVGVVYQFFGYSGCFRLLGLVLLFDVLYGYGYVL